MSKRDFKRFSPRAGANTFKPVGETKQGFVDRVHGQITRAESIGHIWQVYFTNRYAMRSEAPLEPEAVEILKDCFYAGVATMFHLMSKSSEGGDSEAEIEAGAQKLARLQEELETYEKARR